MLKVLCKNDYGSKERKSSSASENESYNHLPDKAYLKDESEPGMESHPGGGNKIFRGIGSGTSLVWRTVSIIAGEKQWEKDWKGRNGGLGKDALSTCQSYRVDFNLILQKRKMNGAH